MSRKILTTAAICALSAFLGCRETEKPAENPRVDSGTIVSPLKEDSGSPVKSDDSPLFEAEGVADVLGRAADNFSGVFSDDEEKGDDTEEGGGVDFSLVDDETKRKYSDDRTLIAPTLAQRGEELEAAPKYRLEYKFPQRANLAWNVVHLVRKRVSYGGTESLIETSSTTWRRWEFQDATDDGKVKARHWIDRMILRQNEEGKEPIDYDSERDLAVPKEIAAFGTEKAVGVVLETFEINPLGVMSNKKKLVAEYQGREGDSNVMTPFPEGELAVGDVWTIPYTLYLKGSNEAVKPCRIIERFRLDKIDEKYATISFKTTLTSIIDDPVVEGALAERLFSGVALFDRELGLAVRTELNFKKTVPGAFGFASFLEYNCQVVEKLDREKSDLFTEGGSLELSSEAPSAAGEGVE